MVLAVAAIAGIVAMFAGIGHQFTMRKRLVETLERHRDRSPIYPDRPHKNPWWNIPKASEMAWALVDKEGLVRTSAERYELWAALSQNAFIFFVPWIWILKIAEANRWTVGGSLAILISWSGLLICHWFATRSKMEAKWRLLRSLEADCPDLWRRATSRIDTPGRTESWRVLADAADLPEVQNLAEKARRSEIWAAVPISVAVLGLVASVMWMGFGLGG